MFLFEGGKNIMLKTSNMVYKTLIVGVIVLFVGVGIQPAFAVNVSTYLSEDENDCNLCPKDSNLHLVRLKSMIDRLETLNNRLSVISKHNPEIADIYRELSDRISTLTGLNLVLKPVTFFWSFPILCTFLYPLWWLLVYLVEVGDTIIFLIASPIFYILNYLVNTFDCYWLTPK